MLFIFVFGSAIRMGKRKRELMTSVEQVEIAHPRPQTGPCVG